jgi:hypothetical protein
MAVQCAGAQTRRMQAPSLGEVAITTTLLSIYVGARGADRTLGAIQSMLGPFGRPQGP